MSNTRNKNKHDDLALSANENLGFYFRNCISLDDEKIDDTTEVYLVKSNDKYVVRALPKTAFIGASRIAACPFTRASEFYPLSNPTSYAALFSQEEVDADDHSVTANVLSSKAYSADELAKLNIDVNKLEIKKFGAVAVSQPSASETDELTEDGIADLSHGAGRGFHSTANYTVDEYADEDEDDFDNEFEFSNYFVEPSIKLKDDVLDNLLNSYLMMSFISMSLMASFEPQRRPINLYLFTPISYNLNILFAPSVALFQPTSIGNFGLFRNRNAAASALEIDAPIFTPSFRFNH